MRSAFTPEEELPTTEDELRVRLVDVLGEAKTYLTDYRSPDPARASEDERASAAAQLDILTDLLAEAIRLNDRLRNVEDLSVDGALVSGAVTVAVSALSDTIEVLSGQLDVAAA